LDNNNEKELEIIQVLEGGTIIILEDNTIMILEDNTIKIILR